MPPSAQPLRARLSVAAAFLAVVVLGTPSHSADAATEPRPSHLDVSFVPTPEDVIIRMLEMAEVHESDYVVDLGSGDGRIVIVAAREFGVERAMGVDIDPQRISEAQQNARAAGVTDRVIFVEGDLFKSEFHDADVLTMYLLPNLNLRLRPLILEKMAPGTRIVSHAFDMGEWEPDMHEQVDNRDIYLWIVPAQVSGEWEFEHDDGTRFKVTLNQEFQRITGRATIDERHLPLSSISLNGDRIRFTLDDQRYIGIIDGDQMTAAEEEDSFTGWQAQRY